MKIFFALLFISLATFAQTAQELCKQLVGDGSGKDGNARTALMKLTHSASKNNGDARVKHEAVILSALKRSSSFEVSTFLIQQLDLCGGKASLPVLASLLNHNELGPNATRTFSKLAKHDTKQAREIILNAYNKQASPYLLNAISVLKLADSKALNIYKRSVADNDLKAFALQGLAQAANATDSQTLLSEFAKASKVFRSRAFRLNLVFTEALGQKDKKAANDHLEKLKAEINKDEIPFITGIASVDFTLNGVSDTWLDSLPQENIHTQTGIIRLLKSNHYPGIDTKLESRAKAMPTATIYMKALAAINAKKAAPLVLSGLKSKNANVRSEASQLALNYGSKFAVSLLNSLIQKGEASNDDTAMVKSMVSSKNINNVTALWQNLNPNLNLVFIEITNNIKNDTVATKMIHAAKSSDKKVQRAALKALKNVVSKSDYITLKKMLSMEEKSSSVRYLQAALAESIAQSEDSTINELFSSLEKSRNQKLLVAFAKSNRKEVLPLLSKDIQSGNQEIQKETIKTLSAISPDLSAKLLLMAIQKCSDERNRILAARALAEASVNGTAAKNIRQDYLAEAIKMNLPEKEKKFLKDKMKTIK